MEQIVRNFVKYSRKLWSCSGKIAVGALANQLQRCIAIFIGDDNDNYYNDKDDDDDNDESKDGENDPPNKQQHYALDEV